MLYTNENERLIVVSNDMKSVHYMHDSIYLKYKNGFVNQGDDAFWRVSD